MSKLKTKKPIIPINDFAVHALGLTLYPKQREILEDITTNNYRVVTLALGRRSGKSLITALLAVYCGLVKDEEYKACLRPGEKFHIVSVANSQDQAKIILNNIRSMLISSPFKAEIVRETAEVIELRNGCVFKSMPASSRSGRGLAIPVLLLDELAFAIDSDSSTGGGALYQALSPSVAQFGKSGMIVALSSPFAQQGIFWELFQQANSGKFPDMKSYQLPTWIVNPTIPIEFLLAEKERDPETFKVEFGAQFANNLSALLSPELVDHAVRNSDAQVIPPERKYYGQYVIGLDPAKGNRDDYVAVVGHYREDGVFMVDLIHHFQPTLEVDGKPQVDIGEVESWILLHAQSYGTEVVALDQYNSAGTIQRLQDKINITEYIWSLPKQMKAFSKLRQAFTAGKIEIPNNKKLVWQLKNLTVVYKGGGWRVTGGTQSAVDDMVFALACAMDCVEDPSEDGQWISAMS